MMSKRSLISALVGLNLLLLGVLLFSSISLPAAYAQRAGASQNFIAITARADDSPPYNVLFLFDLGERKMHCFAPTRDRSGNVQYRGFRDLAQDFSR